MALKLIAQSGIYKNMSDQWQVFIYEDTSDTVTVQTIKVISDFKLRRGESSPNKKTNNFLITKIDFAILDMALFLSNRIRGKQAGLFQAILKKNGNIYFRGNLSANFAPYDFTKSNVNLKLTIFDGLTRLKEFSDFGSLPSGKVKFSELFRAILNKIGLDQQLIFYFNMYPIYDGTDPDYDFATEAMNDTGLQVEDLISGLSGANYYDLLQVLLRMFDLDIFSLEGSWYIRQNVSVHAPTFGNTEGTKIYTVNQSTGAVAASQANLAQAFSLDDLEYNPETFFLKGLSACSFTVKILEQFQKPATEIREEIDWKNPYFKTSEGWTVNSGTAKFLPDSMQLQAGGNVSQQSSTLLNAGDVIIIKLGAVSTRFVDSNLSRIDNALNCPLFRIAFVSTNGTTYYWNFTNNVWDATVLDASLIGQKISGYYKFTNSGAEYIPDYVSACCEKSFEITIPAGLISGYIKIFLYGGAAPYYNYPREISAQHNYCVVKRKATTDNTIKTPSSLVINSKQTGTFSGNKQDISVPFHDWETYSQRSTWMLFDGSRVRTWHKFWIDDVGLSLLDLLSKEILRFNGKDLEAVDMNLLPGSTLAFNKLFKATLTGTERHYLPVYEESELVRDKRRFLALEHVWQNVALNTSTEYKFTDAS